MTVSASNNTRRVTYQLNAGATQSTWTVPFEFNSHTELSLIQVNNTNGTTVLYNSGQGNLTSSNVSGGSGSTGSITFSLTGASGTGSTVVILRDVALARATDFPSTGAFDITQLNSELDNFLYIQADNKDRAGRSLHYPDRKSVV